MPTASSALRICIVHGMDLIGSVGLPLPGCVVRARPDGELEVLGPSDFQGTGKSRTAR